MPAGQVGHQRLAMRQCQRDLGLSGVALALDQAQFEVQSAYQRATQGQQVVHLYREKILPAAQRNLESAQANASR